MLTPNFTTVGVPEGKFQPIANSYPSELIFKQATIVSAPVTSSLLIDVELHLVIFVRGICLPYPRSHVTVNADSESSTDRRCGWKPARCDRVPGLCRPGNCENTFPSGENGEVARRECSNSDFNEQRVVDNISFQVFQEMKDGTLKGRVVIDLQ